MHQLTLRPNMLISLINQWTIFNGWIDGQPGGPMRGSRNFCQGVGVQARRPEYRIRTWDTHTRARGRAHTRGGGGGAWKGFKRTTWTQTGGGHGRGSSEPPEPKLDPPLLIETSMHMYANAQAFWLHPTWTCNSYVLQKNIWAELSYEFGPSCLIDLGRVGMGRVGFGPSCP